MTSGPDGSGRTPPRRRALVALVWALVAIPLLWGVWTTLKKSMVLFR